MTFDCEKLRDARKERKETIEETALAIGISKAALSQIETGGCNPRLDTLSKISAHFNKPLDFFFNSGANTVVSTNAA